VVWNKRKKTPDMRLSERDLYSKKRSVKQGVQNAECGGLGLPLRGSPLSVKKTDNLKQATGWSGFFF
jgi:hypothetical protein